MKNEGRLVWIGAGYIAGYFNGRMVNLFNWKWHVFYIGVILPGAFILGQQWKVILLHLLTIIGGN